MPLNCHYCIQYVYCHGCGPSAHSVWRRLLRTHRDCDFQSLREATKSEIRNQQIRCRVDERTKRLCGSVAVWRRAGGSPAALIAGVCVCVCVCVLSAAAIRQRRRRSFHRSRQLTTLLQLSQTATPPHPTIHHPPSHTHHKKFVVHSVRFCHCLPLPPSALGSLSIDQRSRHLAPRKRRYHVTPRRHSLFVATSAYGTSCKSE